MSTYRSKRIRAWDFAWSHIESLAGIGREDLSDAQVALRAALDRLNDTPLPARAIEDMALAIHAAWRIGREGAG